MRLLGTQERAWEPQEGGWGSGDPEAPHLILLRWPLFLLLPHPHRSWLRLGELVGGGMEGGYPSKWERTTKADHPREWGGGWDLGTRNSVKFVSFPHTTAPAWGEVRT